MYVLTLNKDLLATDASIAKVLKRVSAVGRRTSDTLLAPPKCLTLATAVGPAEYLLRYLAEIGETNS